MGVAKFLVGGYECQVVPRAPDRRGGIAKASWASFLMFVGESNQHPEPRAYRCEAGEVAPGRSLVRLQLCVPGAAQGGRPFNSEFVYEQLRAELNRRLTPDELAGCAAKAGGEEELVAEVIPTDITSIQPGSFIGTAALPRADGKLEALEVVVFPEAARGTGEGHFPWDLKPESSMTNATVADLARSPDGRTLKLRYKDGEKTVIVPDGVPVVTFRPGDRSLIVPGAKVFIVAEPEDSQFTVKRLLIGRNGFQPPM